MMNAKEGEKVRPSRRWFRFINPFITSGIGSTRGNKRVLSGCDALNKVITRDALSTPESSLHTWRICLWAITRRSRVYGCASGHIDWQCNKHMENINKNNAASQWTTASSAMDSLRLVSESFPPDGHGQHSVFDFNETMVFHLAHIKIERSISRWLSDELLRGNDAWLVYGGIWSFQVS